MSTERCRYSEKGFCIFENSFESCSSEISVVFGKRMCSTHQIKIFGFIHKQFSLPREYRPKYPYNQNCNRGLGLIAFNPLIEKSSSRVVFREGDKILPTSEEARKYFNVYHNEHYQASLDLLSDEAKIKISKLHRNYLICKQAYKFFTSDYYQVNGNDTTKEIAKQFKSEVESIVKNVLELLQSNSSSTTTTTNFTEFPLVSFRLSKPIEYYYKNLIIFDGKCKPADKPWNSNLQFEGNFLSDDYKIQCDRVLKFETFFKYYLITDKQFPASKYKTATTEKDSIIDDIFYTLRGLHNYHGTLADDLRRWLRRPLLNQYSNKAKCFFPVIPEVISGRQCSMLTRLAYPNTEKKLYDHHEFYIDKDNEYFNDDGFKRTVNSKFLKDNCVLIFQILFRTMMSGNDESNSIELRQDRSNDNENEVDMSDEHERAGKRARTVNEGSSVES